MSKIDQTTEEFRRALVSSTGGLGERIALANNSNELWGHEYQRDRAGEEGAEFAASMLRRGRLDRDVSEQDIAGEMAGLLLSVEAVIAQLDPLVWHDARRVEAAKLRIRQQRKLEAGQS